MSKRLPNDAELERAWMEAQGPAVPALAAYVAEARTDFDAFYFYTYLYATTYFALPGVRERAALFPLAHDEWPLRMGLWDEFFRLPRAVVALGVDERHLLERRFGNLSNLFTEIATGIEGPSVAPEPDRFRARHTGGKPFLLYLGRVDLAKNCDELIADYLALPVGERANLPLVLAGPLQMAVPPDPTIVALGEVEETTKWDALAACEALVIPSQYESMSYVALEAWSVARPVLASGRSSVLIGQCRRSGGGVWYANRAEFAALVESRLFGKADALGAQGHRYATAHFAWEAIERQHLNLASRIFGGT
ncbi:MAG: glycosyltransferase family 4 protein [Candidatus Eremiobacteraeota bacterium]|nr:glycosyltransferase family 4 protein [Candidatus Eremiobacteraeota bacterium]